MRTRPADAADENETAGQEGYSETFHTFTSMYNPQNEAFRLFRTNRIIS